MKKGEIIKSKIHKKLTHWRILDIYKSTSGKTKIWAIALHDTKQSIGFDSIKHEFNINEINKA